jgi:hypothetical protein
MFALHAIHFFLFRNDRTNVLSDIDTMLSDLNRELDQMLDYETTTIRSNVRC